MMSGIRTNAAALLATGYLYYRTTYDLPASLSPNGFPVGQIPHSVSTTDNILFLISMAVLFIPFQFCTLDSWQRCGAWEKRQQSPTWLLLFGALLAACYAVPVFIGMAVRSAGLVIPPASHPLQLFLESLHLQPMVAALVLTGFASAILSTADELLNCCALSFLFDTLLIRRTAERRPSEELAVVASGRFYTAAFAFLAAGISLLGLHFGRQISDMALAVFSVQVIFAVPLSVLLFRPAWAQHLSRAAIAATSVAFVAAIALVAAGWVTADRVWSDAGPVGGAVLGFVVFAIWGGAQAVSRKRRAETSA